MDQTLIDVGESGDIGKHICHCIHTCNVPIPGILIEGGGVKEHTVHGSYRGDIPIVDVLIERRCLFEHFSHLRDG